MAAALAGGCIDSLVAAVVALAVVVAAELAVTVAGLAAAEHHQASAFHWR